MRIVHGFLTGLLGFLTGVLGALAGWAGLAFTVVGLGGPDRDGAIAMGAFDIGSIGGVIGFVAGVFLFVKFGMVAQRVAAVAAPLEPASPSSDGAAATPPARHAPAKRISRPFAAIVLVAVGGLAWSGWYEFIRSPYLTHGFMTLALQFRLPADMPAPADGKDIEIVLDEGGRTWPGSANPRWRGHQGNQVVILGNVTMSYKTGRRTITLTVPGAPTQSWTLDLPSDPDPTPDYTAWRPSGSSPNAIELNYRLTADR